MSQQLGMSGRRVGPVLKASLAIYACALVVACMRHDTPVDAPDGCLAAVIEHKEHTEAADGITHDVSYRERFYRCEGNVWTERVLPVQVHSASETPHGHEMPPLHELAQWVAKISPNAASLTLVSHHDRQLIAISPESYDSVHFDADFAAQSHLISRDAVARMERDGKRAPRDGALWHSKRSGSDEVAVLWSDRLDFPLEIETRRDGGRRTTHITVTQSPLPADAEWPWRKVGPYVARADSDFMD